MTHPPFHNRAEAGERLAQRLREALASGAWAPPADAPRLVAALPRGGVPVAVPVAAAFGGALTLALVRKIGAPGHPELALGAVADAAPAPVAVLNDDVCSAYRLDDAEVQGAQRRSEVELAKRAASLRGDQPPPDWRGRAVAVVDDGIATGATVRAAIRAIRQGGAVWVGVATPVAPADTAEELGQDADALLVLRSPTPFLAVGAHYRSFPQVSDAEVRAALRAGGDKT